MSVYDFHVLDKAEMEILQNKQAKARRTELLDGNSRIITYIPGIHVLVIGDNDDEYTVINSTGSVEMIRKGKMTSICRTVKETDTDSSVLLELIDHLLNYLSPGSILQFTATRIIFTEDSFIRVTLAAISKQIELKYTEDPYLNSEKYQRLLGEKTPKEFVIQFMKSDFRYSRMNSLQSIVTKRAKEEKQKLLSVGSTRNRTAIRNTAVELLCRLHIDCGGYLTTNACLSYISEVMNIDSSFKYSTFRSYVDEAKALYIERGMTKGPLWAVPLLGA